MEVIHWFHSFLEQVALKEGGLDKMLHLIPFCHEARRSDGAIRQFLEDFFDDDGGDCFSRLWHYIGRLAKHIEALEAIYDCLAEYPRIGRSVLVEGIPGSPQDEFPLLPLETFPRELLASMFPDGESDEQLECKENLRSMARSIGKKHLIGRLKERCGKTRVHAELLILDHFRHNNLYFFEDTYIGRSKPSCYLCYRYFQVAEANGFGVVLPETSNKLRADWRCPDVHNSRGEEGNRRRKKDMRIMVKFITRDLLEQLRCLGVSPWRPDSTFGVSSLPRRRILAKPASVMQEEDHADALVDEGAEEEQGAAEVVLTEDAAMVEQLVDKEDLPETRDAVQEATRAELIETLLTDEPATKDAVQEATRAELLETLLTDDPAKEEQILAEEVTASFAPHEEKELVDTEDDDEEEEGTDEEDEEGSYDEDEDEDSYDEDEDVVDEDDDDDDEEEDGDEAADGDPEELEEAALVDSGDEIVEVVVVEHDTGEESRFKVRVEEE